MGDEIAAAPASPWEERPYRRGEVAGYRLVVAATDDPAVNAAVFDDGEAAGVWVNGADDPAHCSFTLPSVVRRGPLTGDRVDRRPQPGAGRVAAPTARGRVRPRIRGADRAAGRGAGEAASGRRASTEGLDWQKALDSDMLALIKSGQVQQARERLQACLSSSSD